jgi:hypothetical protein
MRDPIFIMVMGGTLKVHCSMVYLEHASMVKHYRLPGRCKGLAKDGQQQKDCKQSAHDRWLSG